MCFIVAFSMKACPSRFSHIFSCPRPSGPLFAFMCIILTSTFCM